MQVHMYENLPETFLPLIYTKQCDRVYEVVENQTKKCNTQNRENEAQGGRQ